MAVGKLAGDAAGVAGSRLYEVVVAHHQEALVVVALASDKYRIDTGFMLS